MDRRTYLTLFKFWKFDNFLSVFFSWLSRPNLFWPWFLCWRSLYLQKRLERRRLQCPWWRGPAMFARLFWKRWFWLGGSTLPMSWRLGWWRLFIKIMQSWLWTPWTVRIIKNKFSFLGCAAPASIERFSSYVLSN